MSRRVSLRRRNPYNTKTNRIRRVKTPGGRLVAQHIKKTGIVRKWATCEIRLPGIKKFRPEEMKRAPKKNLRVTRAFGGEKCTEKIIIKCFLSDDMRLIRMKGKLINK